LGERILFGKSAHEYFRDLVAETLTRRRLKVREITEFYLVNLLAEFLDSEKLFVTHPDGSVEAEPLAFILLRSLRGTREQRFQGLKRLGDTSLFVSGFFGDSLSRSLVDIDYYIAMGERAYDALKDTARGPAKLDDLYGELSQKFGNFVDIFAEIAEVSNLTSNRGLIKLYERFLATRDERVAQLLRDRGVALFGGPGKTEPPKGGLPQ
jgi:hypothetical protein